MTQHHTPRYWIAQHIEDLFRKETSNVGVILAVNGHIYTRFLGENESGQLDGRSLRQLPHPKVFKQWVEFWRETCAEEQEVDPKALSGHHYRVIEGGALTGTEDNAHTHMLDYLFRAIVSPQGASHALMMDWEEAEANVRAQLDKELHNAFHGKGLLEEESPLLIKHPIRERHPIQGHAVTHTPSFSQQNGKLYVMEHVDFMSHQRQRISDRAGATAYMFNDLRARYSNVETITIIRLDDDARQDRRLSYGLGMLQSESTRVINWLDDDARSAFLDERLVVAQAGEL